MEAITNNRLLFLYTAIASLLLTLWAITVDPILNPDALIYLSAATEFSAGNFSDGFAIYKWPFYSALISLVHTITGLSVQNSAYTINAFMHVLASTGFVACVYSLGGKKRTLLIAAIVILLFPGLNKYRAFVIRDAGFIAFYLWAIYYLFTGLNSNKVIHFVLAFCSISAAVLFRTEAIAPLIITSCYLLYSYSTNTNLRFFWLCLTISTSIVLFFGMSIWLFGEHSIRNYSSIWEFISGSTEYATQNLSFRIETLQKHVLNEFSEQFASTVLTVSVAIIVFYETLRRLSFITAYLSWHAIKNKLVFNNNKAKNIFYVLCAIQIVLLFLFALINLFLVSRHTLALCLTILLATPFSIDYFYQKWISQKNSLARNRLRWAAPLIAILLILTGIDGLNVKSNKPQTSELGSWLEERVNPEASVYSNSSLILHYANRNPAHYNLRFNWKETDELLSTKKIYRFNYVAILISSNFESSKAYISKKLKLQPIDEIFNSDNQLLLLYDLRNVTKDATLADRYLKIKK